MPILLKRPEQLKLMREAGRIVAETLLLLREAVRPGITTAELDALAERHILRGTLMC
ncbi:M24 family metallopeptidase [Streptococcus pneumoniae]|uniref:M24 family metallopeptidase n=1 Tax=Streptococcus pneumoniae TaxID=1313 RepID=UPI0016622AAA|nr:M24 family metallopeptidase [Streptococcus pneumoniae]